MDPDLPVSGAETSLLTWPLLPLTLFVVLLVLLPVVITLAVGAPQSPVSYPVGKHVPPVNP